MASYTVDQFRTVLTRLNFEKIRSKKHETWRNVLPNGTILRVRISHRHKRDIPKWLFYEMLRQAGIDEEGFVKLLRE
jgi:plasmid stabilization system protein ParE